MNKKAIAAIVATSVIVGTVGCGSSNISGEVQQGAYEDEIITTTPVNQDKTMITVRVEVTTGQDEIIENMLEEKFPDVDIVLRRDDTAYPAYTMKANLKAGVESDIILSRRLPSVTDIASDYLLDLSSEDFVNNYYMNAVDSCATADGRLFYLPGPSDVYGIVYDKTVFDENGWEVPHSYSEFVELIDTINNSGVKADDGVTDITAYLPSIVYPDAFQIFFHTYSYDLAFAGIDNFRWLTAYQSGEGSMVGHMESAVENFKKLFDDGILSLDVLDTRPRIRSQMLYKERSLAMTTECQNAVTYVQTMGAEAGIAEDDIHQLGMFPFWTSDDSDSDYLYMIPSYYMAINKASAEESEEKKQLLLDIYSYLSSVEGQEILLDGGFQVSNISGVPMVENDFSKDIIDTIERGHIINTFGFVNGDTENYVENYMLGTLKDLIQGNITTKEWLEGADNTREDYLAGNLSTDEVYGQSEELLTKLETAYTVADMYRELTGADIGIVLGGGYRTSTNGYIYKGDITHNSLLCITPIKETASDPDNVYVGKICVADMTGQQILDTLNSDNCSTDIDRDSHYYIASGLQVTFNPWEGKGKRVISCKLPDGSDIDTEATYKVAYFYNSISSDGLTIDNYLDMTWEESFAKWLDDIGGVVKKPEMTLTLVYE